MTIMRLDRNSRNGWMDVTGTTGDMSEQEFGDLLYNRTAWRARMSGSFVAENCRNGSR